MKYVLSILTIVLLALSVSIAPAQTVAQTDQARSNVRPDVGPPGATFEFFATGFRGGDIDDGDDEDEAKEEVSIWINRPDERVTTDGIRRLNEVTDTGRADWTWTAPENAQPGQWSAVAVGNETGRTAVIRFEVRPGADVPPSDPAGLSSNVQPNAAPGGTIFAFYATGFADEEELSVWLNAPDGRVLAAEDADIEGLHKTTPSGRADWLWNAPVTAQPGMWSAVAHDQESGVERVIAFEIMQ